MLRRLLVALVLLGVGVAFGQVSMSEVFLAMSSKVAALEDGEVTGFYLVGSEAQWGSPVFSTDTVVVFIEVEGWSGNVEIAGVGLYNLLEWWVVGRGNGLAGLYGRWWQTSGPSYSCDYGGWGWEDSGVDSAAVVCTDNDFPTKSIQWRTKANYLGGASGWSSNGGSTRLNGRTTHTYTDTQGCTTGGTSVEWELFGVQYPSSASAHNHARQTVEGRLGPLFNGSARCGPWHAIVDSDPSIESAAAAAALAYLAMDSSGFSPDDFFDFGSPVPEFVDDTGGDGEPGDGGGGGGGLDWGDAPGDEQTQCSIIDIPCNLRKLFVPQVDWGERFGELPETHATRFPFALAQWSPGNLLDYGVGDQGDFEEFTCPTINIHWALPGADPGPLAAANVDYNWCDNVFVDKWVSWFRPLLLWIFGVSLAWAGYRKVASA